MKTYRLVNVILLVINQFDEFKCNLYEKHTSGELFS